MLVAVIFLPLCFAVLHVGPFSRKDGDLELITRSLCVGGLDFISERNETYYEVSQKKIAFPNLLLVCYLSRMTEAFKSVRRIVKDVGLGRNFKLV